MHNWWVHWATFQLWQCTVADNAWSCCSFCTEAASVNDTLFCVHTWSDKATGCKSFLWKSANILYKLTPSLVTAWRTTNAAKQGGTGFKSFFFRCSNDNQSCLCFTLSCPLPFSCNEGKLILDASQYPVILTPVFYIFPHIFLSLCPHTGMHVWWRQ